MADSTPKTVKLTAPLEKGDTVRLPVVNAPLMTVTQVYANGDIRCEWFDLEQHHCERVFADAINVLEIDEASLKAKEAAKKKAEDDAAAAEHKAAAAEEKAAKKAGGHG